MKRNTPHAMSAPAVPALLIAAPASGQGKTTITSALARLYTRQGHRVRVFKCGPDFLDPYWHTLASDAPVYQLDLWMTGQAVTRTSRPDASPATDAGEALWQHGPVRASYFHAWFASCPEAVVELFAVPQVSGTAQDA
jgi:cobyrinic acid a,c-diamide synthase